MGITFCYTMYIMKKQGDNMKLSELVNEVNQEQELSQLDMEKKNGQDKTTKA